MMGDSYQPIQLPQGLGTGEAMAGVGDALTSAAQWSRQRRMDAADLLRSEEDRKRRAEQDFQAAYTQAQKMAAMGDLAGAKALLAPHVKNLQLAQEASPGAPGTSSMAAQAAPRIAPLDGAREPAGAVPAPPMQPLSPGPRGEGPPPPTGNPGQMEAFKAPPGTPPTPTVVPPSNNSENEGNPLFAAAAGGKAKKMRQLLRFTGPGGQEMSLDPEKARETRLGQRMQRLDEAFQNSDDPTVKELYPQMRPALMASDQDVDPSDVFKYMRGVADDRRRAADASAKEAETLRREDQRGKEWDRRFAQAEPGRDRRAAMAQGNRSATVQQGEQRLELSKETQARSITKDIFAATGFKEEQARNRKFNDMAAQIAQPNAALDAATAGTWVKQAQGGTGVISDSDMEQFWGKIGGVTTKTSQWVQNVLDGKIEPGKRQTVMEAVKWLAGRAKENLGQVREALKFGLETSPNVSQYAGSMVGTYFPEERASVKQKLLDAGAQGKREGRAGTAPKAVDDYLKMLGSD